MDHPLHYYRLLLNDWKIQHGNEPFSPPSPCRTSIIHSSSFSSTPCTINLQGLISLDDEGNWSAWMKPMRSHGRMCSPHRRHPRSRSNLGCDTAMHQLYHLCHPCCFIMLLCTLEKIFVFLCNLFLLIVLQNFCVIYGKFMPLYDV